MIRPIEMQMLLPRTESVGNTQQHENQRVVNENMYAANEVAKEVKHSSETVVKKDANEFAEYKYDAKEKGNGTYQNPQRHHNKKKDSSKTENERMESKSFLPDGQPRINIQI